MSSSPVIPREKLSAYQRWEMHAFDTPGDFTSPTRATSGPGHEAQLEIVRREAYAKGHAEGLIAGTQKSCDDARRLHDVLAAVTQQHHDIEQRLADDLLQLALTLARQMVRRALAVHPDLIVPLVKDALMQLAAPEIPLTMTLHPADAAVVRTQLSESMEAGRWRIVEDAGLQRGGCLLQSATSQLDATVETRWRHLTTALGMDDRWLD